MIALTEKYRPATLNAFAGLRRPKAILSRFIADPGPCAWLFLGPSGVGKTTVALAMQQAIGGELHHIPSKECDLKTVQEVCDKCHYYPWSGKWHFVLVDEADQMSRAAQLAFLSKLDSTAAPPNTIFVFTANSTDLLEDRFLSRVRTLPFDSPDAGDLYSFLGTVAQSEGCKAELDYQIIGRDSKGNVRSALMLLEMEIMMAADEAPARAVTPNPTVEDYMAAFA